MENPNQKQKEVYSHSNFVHELQSKAYLEDKENTKISLATLTSIELNKYRSIGFKRGFWFALLIVFVFLFAIFSKQYGYVFEIYLIAIFLLVFEYFYKLKKLTPKTLFANRMYFAYSIFLVLGYAISSVLLVIGGYYLFNYIPTNHYLVNHINNFYIAQKYNWFNYSNFYDFFTKSDYRIYLAGSIIFTPILLFGFLAGIYYYHTKPAGEQSIGTSKGATGIQGDEEVAKGFIHRFKFDVYNTLITGATGSGKTQLLNRVITDRSMYKNRSVFFDAKGDVLQTFFRQGDVFWDITDGRSVLWNFLAEAEDIAQLRQFAYYLIEDVPGDTNPFFRNSARDILYAKLLELWRAGKTTNTDFISKINDINAEIATENQDVIKTYKESISNLQFINTTGAEFKLKEWLRNSNDRRNILIGVNLEYIDIQRPFFRLFLSIINAMITGKSWTNAERINIYIDEFANVGEIDNIDSALSLCREQNVGYFLSTQSLENIRSIYRDKFANIIDNCNNSYNFKAKDVTSARMISEQYGVEDEKQMLISQGTSAAVSQTSSMTENLRKKHTVEIKELQELKPLQYFANFLTETGIKIIKAHTLPLLVLSKNKNLAKFVRRDDWTQQALNIAQNNKTQNQQEKPETQDKLERNF